MTASLIGRFSQARVVVSVTGRSRGSRFSSQSVSSLLDGAAARIGKTVWRARFWTRFRAQQSLTASSIPSSTRTIQPPGVLAEVRSTHAAASFDPRRNSEPSSHMRWRMTASLRATATMARRRPFVLISLTPHAFRLDQVIERINMAFAAA